MSILVYILLAVVVVGALGVAFVPALIGSSRADKRMKALQGDIQANRRTADAVRARDVPPQADPGHDQAADRRTRPVARSVSAAGPDLPGWHEDQGAGLDPQSDHRRRRGARLCYVIQILAGLAGVPLPLFHLVFGAAAGYLLPRLYLGFRRGRHQAAYLNELPNAVEAIVRGVKSGLPLNDSMRLVAKEAKEPIKTEFQRVLDQQALGKSTSEAVQVLFERMPLPEVNFFVVVITVQQQAGGNLSEALGNLARVLRNRKKMKQKIKAMSSEAKASAGIIGSLPYHRRDPRHADHPELPAAAVH